MKARLLVILTVGMLVLTPAISAFAQQGIASGLREEPRTESGSGEKIVPVSRTLIDVDVWLNKECGSPFYTEEKVKIFFKTDTDGYVTLYDIDTQGNVLVIFPNRHTPDNFVRAGQTFQIPAEQASYNLVVEGPEGIEYIEAMASVDPSYHWNYRNGKPRWLKDLNLEGNKAKEYEAGTMDQDEAVAYRESTEYQNAPEGLGALGLDSLAQNFQISESLREQVRSKLVVRPKEPEPSQQPQQPQPKVEPVAHEEVQNYSTDTCYMYIVDSTPPPAPQPTQPPPSSQGYLEQLGNELQQIQSLSLQKRPDRLIAELSGHTLFTSGSSSLVRQARQDLSLVASILLRYPETRISVMGHTDSIGDASYNQRLSEARAKTVADLFITEGVAQHRLNWVGYGETMPVASNSTEAGRQRNRRVELEIRYAR